MKLRTLLLLFALIPGVAHAQTDGSVTGGTRGTRSSLAGCTYNSPQPVLQSGQQVALQCDQNGNLQTTGGGGGGGNVTITSPVDANGNVTINPVDSGNTTMTDTANHALKVNVVTSTGVAQGSTTSGQTLAPIGCRTLTSAPTDTTAQTNMPSCTTAGALRVDNSANTQPSNLTQVNGTTLLANTGATGAGSPRVTVATDTATAAGSTPAAMGAGATGSAVPSGGVYQSSNVGGNLTGNIACGSSVVYDASTNGSTQLVGLQSGQSVYVCGYTIFSAGTVNVELDYGTGTACATGTTKIVPAYQLTAQTGVSDQGNIFRGLKAIASNELCLKTSAGVAVQAIVYYTQF